MVFKYIKTILTKKPDNVLILLNSGLGNAVQTIPAILELKRLQPKLKIILAGTPGNIELLKSPKIADAFFSVPTDCSLLRYMLLREPDLIRKYRYVFVFLSNTPAGLIYLKKAGLAKHIISVIDDSNRHYRQDITVNYTADQNESLTNLSLLEAAGIHGAKPHPANLFITKQELSNAKNLLATYKITKKKFAILHPGWSIKQTIKALPPKMIRQLIAKLKNHYDSIALLLGPEEKKYAEKLGLRTFDDAQIIAESFSMRMLAAVLANATVLISADTGPAHIASAAGTPVVSCFGPTSPTRCAASGFGKQIIMTADSNMECLQCEENNEMSCSQNKACINNLKVDDIVNQALALSNIN